MRIASNEGSAHSKCRVRETPDGRIVPIVPNLGSREVELEIEIGHDVAVAIVSGAMSRDVRLERCGVAQLHGG